MSSSVERGDPCQTIEHAAELAARVAGLPPEFLTLEVVQLLMATAIKGYSRLLDEGVSFPPFGTPSEITATEAVRAASAILRAADLETFELALWQTWGQ